MTSDDRALIESWKAGDQGAATALVERHADPLRRMAYTFGARDEIDELVQDVFVRAFNSLATFRGDKATFRSWLITILRRLILDRARATRRSERLTSLDDAGRFATSDYNTLDDLIAGETERKVLGIIRSAGCLELLKMRLAGHRWRSIGLAMGLPEATVKVRYHRMRATLRAAAL